MIAFDRPEAPPRGKQAEQNVLGGALASCSTDPLTGFFRDGCCRSGPGDVGMHTVCCLMTKDFLSFTVAVGNDLVTPHPEWDFAGLVEGDSWCLCAARWLEAVEAGHAPPVFLQATHKKTLSIVSLELLQKHAVQTA